MDRCSVLFHAHVPIGLCQVILSWALSNQLHLIGFPPKARCGENLRLSLSYEMARIENIWEFELKGTERSWGEKEGYYSVWKTVLTYHHHVVEKGKWFRSAARRFGAMNIGCDFNARSVMSMEETFLWHINKLLSYPKGLVPWAFRQKLKQHIKTL